MKDCQESYELPFCEWKSFGSSSVTNFSTSFVARTVPSPNSRLPFRTVMTVLDPRSATNSTEKYGPTLAFLLNVVPNS